MDSEGWKIAPVLYWRVLHAEADPYAFVNRAVYNDMFADSFFNASGSPTTRKQAQDFIDGMMKVIAPFLNGEVRTIPTGGSPIIVRPIGGGRSGDFPTLVTPCAPGL
jgi:hypothetical protein